jgi:hypothetical protein
MIKLTPIENTDFLSQYKLFVITNHLIPIFANYLLEIDEPYLSAMNTHFSDEQLEQIVFKNADELEVCISNIYNALPILSEMYCCEYFLKEFEISQHQIDTSNLPLRTNVNKILLDEVYIEIKQTLLVFINGKDSRLISDLYEKMSLNNTIVEKRDLLLKLISMKKGSYRLSDYDLDLFPSWVFDFKNKFNYSRMATEFGYEITTLIDSDICPYCNEEPILTINEPGDEARPALDHYFPKSKFPFLSTTLSNLIPAGSMCNGSYKISVAMFDYCNPYISGILNAKLFRFEHCFDEGVNLNNLSVHICEQGTLIDKNVELFKIKSRYNHRNLKQEYIEIYESFEYLKELDEDNLMEQITDHRYVRQNFKIDLQASPKLTRAHKFKIDALNELSGMDFEMNS